MPEESPHSERAEGTTTPAQHENTFAATLIEYGKVLLITLCAAVLLKSFVIDAFRIPSTSMENTLQIGDFLLVNKLAYGLHTPRHFPFSSTSLSSWTIPLLRSVHRGDVIVFEFPGSSYEVHPSESVNYIKRCIGLPGDTVEIRSGKVFVNGIETSFPAHGRRTSHSTGSPLHYNAEFFPIGSSFSDINYGPIVVPKRGDRININPAAVSPWKIFIEREGHSVQTRNESVLIDGAETSAYRVQKNYYFVLGDNRDNSIDSRYWGFVPDDHLIGEALCIYWSWDPEVPVYSISEKYSTIRWNRIGILIR
jgi:signal peptidase I